MDDLSKHDQKLEFILQNAARIFAEKSYHQYVLSKLADYLSASSQSYTIESVNIADSRKLK